LHEQKPHHDAQDAEYVGLKSVDRFHMLLSCSWRITHRHQPHTNTWNIQLFDRITIARSFCFSSQTGGVDRISARCPMETLQWPAAPATPPSDCGSPQTTATADRLGRTDTSIPEDNNTPMQQSRFSVDDGGIVSIKQANGADVDVKLLDNAKVFGVQAATIADVKPNDFIGWLPRVQLASKWCPKVATGR
jgi:hypothetical protein